jgi:hypothetical protein
MYEESLDSGPADRAVIARKAANARWGKVREKRAKAGADGRSAREVPEPEVLPPGSGSYQSIEDYDRTVGPPNDWGQAQQREKVIGELTLNQTRRVDLENARTRLDKERGTLMPLSEVEDREERADEIYQRHLSAVLDLVATIVPPEQINAARAKAADWLAERQRLVAEEIGG